MVLLQRLERRIRVGDEVIVRLGPAADDVPAHGAVLVVEVLARGPAAHDRRLRVVRGGVGEHLRALHLLAHRDVERHPQRDRRHRAGDERCHRLGHPLVDDLDVLRIDVVRAQRRVEEHVRRRARRRRNLLALEVGEAVDALVPAHPQLRGRELDVVHEEHLPLPAGGEVRDDGAGDQHLDAAADHRLEQLEAGGELHEIELDVVLPERAPVDAEPDLAVHGERMQVADLHLRAGLGDGRRAEHADARADAHGRRRLQELSAVHFHWLSSSG